MEIIRHVCLFPLYWCMHVKQTRMWREQIWAEFCILPVYTETLQRSVFNFSTLEGGFRFLRFQAPKTPLPCKRKALPIKYFVVFTRKHPSVNGVLVKIRENMCQKRQKGFFSKHWKLLKMFGRITFEWPISMTMNHLFCIAYKVLAKTWNAS